MLKKIDKNQVRLDKHERIRNTLAGTSDRPRLSVYRSTQHIYAQIIDDASGKTLTSASTMDKDLASKLTGLNKSGQAEKVGEAVAKKALKLKISKVVFDRSGYLYTGRVAALAEGARKAGLEF
ncbi:MAG: 50S ribosomal protein L18 [Clostridia bacterium]|nr:50S ribosomal protein L18 [Clostridia bacterium]